MRKRRIELVCGKCHGLVAITFFGAIVFPLKGNSVFITSDEPAVADGDAMGVSSEVGEHGRRSGERTFGIHDPVYVA